jgi:hypothetical protein
MDIRVTSTGKIFYQIPTDIAALLSEAFPASFEKVEKIIPKVVQTARWMNGEGAHTGRPTIRVDCAACHVVNDFGLKPDLFAEYFDKFLCVHAKGQCPPQVFEHYKSIWKPERDRVTGAAV